MSPDTFFFLKGLVALVTTIFVVIHMNLSWQKFDRDDQGMRTGVGQRMRYIAWFLFIILVAAASRDQLAEHAIVERRNVAGLFVVSFSTITAIVSIIEARRKGQRRH